MFVVAVDALGESRGEDSADADVGAHVAVAAFTACIFVSAWFRDNSHTESRRDLQVSSFPGFIEFAGFLALVGTSLDSPDD